MKSLQLRRRERYFQDLWMDVVEVCGEDSKTASDLREIIEFWEKQPGDPDMEPKPQHLRTQVTGLRNEMLRMQGKQPWDWRKEANENR